MGKKQHGRRSVGFRIDGEVLTRWMLRLGDDVRIVGARTETHGTRTAVVFALDIPDAPPQTREVTPVYTRSGDYPDPVSLVEYRWQHADGTETVQPAQDHPVGS